ncbi:hypothetical protein HDU97_001465 [Phlyctochytrium planicorne]|nr:hypothetical protein HDU97_001465 [Phlyctochytrium planicorne]
MASVDTVQSYRGNCTANGSTLTLVSRTTVRVECSSTEQQCIRVTPLDASSQVFSRCTPHKDFATGPFFDQASIAAKNQYFVFTTYDDAKCTQFSTKALKSQHLSAFISNTCAQPDPRTSPNRFAKITCTNGQVTFQDKCDTTCADAKCGIAPSASPEQLCIKNPNDPETFIAGYCMTAAEGMPKMPVPTVVATTTSASATATSSVAPVESVPVTTAKPSSARASKVVERVGGWIVVASMVGSILMTLG